MNETNVRGCVDGKKGGGGAKEEGKVKGQVRESKALGMGLKEKPERV